jgi:hypothetical protein
VRNAFDGDNELTQLPVSIRTIRAYLVILSPLYSVNLSLQSNSASIGDVIPVIVSMVHMLYGTGFDQIETIDILSAVLQFDQARNSESV